MTINTNVYDESEPGSAFVAVESEMANLLKNDINDGGDISITIDPRIKFGLYSQFAAIGLLCGMAGSTLNFCIYYYDGTSNMCANANTLVFLAWEFKFFFAVYSDRVHPWGMKRKFHMIMGWLFTLLVLLTMGVMYADLTASGWLAMNMTLHFCLMFVVVPADGYAVELGQLEPKESKGQIIATAQMIRVATNVLTGIFQVTLINGPSTNSSDCQPSWTSCWSWGLTIGQYYFLMFLLTAAFAAPVVFMKDSVSGRSVVQRSIGQFALDVWDTLQNLVTLYLMVFIFGVMSLGHLKNNAATFIQFYIIKLSNFQSGINSICNSLALVLGIWVFKTYLIQRSWRFTSYFSSILTALLGLLWVLVFYDIGGARNAWVTIFIDLDQTFSHGLSQVLFSLVVIEIAKPGQEATTFELLMTLANASQGLSLLASVSMLYITNSNVCTSSDATCDADNVDLRSEAAYETSSGPSRFSQYTILLGLLSVATVSLAVQFFPGSREECNQWSAAGKIFKHRRFVGRLTLTICILTLTYVVVASVLLLDSNTSCLRQLGGSGC